VVYDRVRAVVPFMTTDRPFAGDVGIVLARLRDGSLLRGIL
jgi:hypothetical protein